MNLSDLKTLGDIGSYAIAILVAAYTFFATRRKDVDEKLEEAKRDRDALASRVSAVEAEAKASPGQNDIHDLTVAMAEMRGEFRALSETLRGQRDLMGRLETVVERHEDHLLRDK